MDYDKRATQIACTPFSAALLGHGEGPAWLPRSGRVAALDMLEGRILTLSIDATAEMHRGVPDDVVAFAHERAKGGFVTLLSDSLCFLDDAWNVSSKVQIFDDPKVRFNDATVAPDGALICGTMAYDQESPLGRVFAIRGDAVTTLRDQIVISNGVQLWEDGHGYFINSANGLVEPVHYKGDALLQTGEPIHIPSRLGMPDGLALDTGRGVWVALFGGGAVVRFAEDGTATHRIDVPTANPTSCAFVGAELDTLIITTSNYGAEHDPVAGTIFVAKPPFTGSPVPSFSG